MDWKKMWMTVMREKGPWWEDLIDATEAQGSGVWVVVTMGACLHVKSRRD
jgi:hypothetical protein